VVAQAIRRFEPFDTGESALRVQIGSRLINSDRALGSVSSSVGSAPPRAAPVYLGQSLARSNLARRKTSVIATATERSVARIPRKAAARSCARHIFDRDYEDSTRRGLPCSIPRPISAPRSETDGGPTGRGLKALQSWNSFDSFRAPIDSEMEFRGLPRRPWSIFCLLHRDFRLRELSKTKRLTRKWRFNRSALRHRRQEFARIQRRGGKTRRLFLLKEKLDWVGSLL
jgi:hypothetical protein